MPPKDKPSANASQVLLSRAHSPTSAAAIHTTKVVQKPLLLRPTSSAPSARAFRQQARDAHAASQRKRKQKPRPLSAAQKRALGVHDIPEAQRKYSMYIPLAKMWAEYVRAILGLEEKGNNRAHVTPASAGAVLVTADFHGAELEVVRCKCVGRVGTKGIVIRDTKSTFVLISKWNQVKIIPKADTVFRFELALSRQGEDVSPDGQHQPLVFEVHGSQFEYRAADRANKKFKMHLSKNL